MNPYIDRMRGVLALLVVVWHATLAGGIFGVKHDQVQNVVAPFVAYTGFNFVVGFVVLSGYCIARSTFMREQKFSFARYMLLRISRIYPALIVCTAIAGVVEYVLLDAPWRIAMWGDGISLQTFMDSMAGISGFRGQFGALAPAYTVSYELLYYLIWGIVLAVFPRRIALLTSALVMPILYYTLGNPFHFSMVLYLSWLIGAALALYEARAIRFFENVPHWLVWALFIFVFVAGNEFCVINEVNIWSPPGAYATLGCGLAFGVLIASLLARGLRESQLDAWLGKISYPLFLVHGPVLIATFSAFNFWNVTINYGASLLLVLIFSLLAAHIVQVLVERPVFELRARLKSRDGGFLPSSIWPAFKKG